MREASFSIVLCRFDYSGNLISTMDYSRKTVYASIYKDILYSCNYHGENKGINLFDLRSGEFLEDKRFPSNSIEGIDVNDDKFYFSDFNKKMIGVFDLSELD